MGNISGLTNVERLMLLNQFKLLRAAAVSAAKQRANDTVTVKMTSAASMYDEQISILERGDVSRYGELANELEPEIPIERTNFVLDVLQMYRVMHGADPSIFFPGFDLNNEDDYSIARYHIERDGMWDEQKPFKVTTDNWNTHRQMSDRYSNQLAAWERLSNRTNLTGDEARAIRDTY